MNKKKKTKEELEQEDIEAQYKIQQEQEEERLRAEALTDEEAKAIDEQMEAEHNSWEKYEKEGEEERIDLGIDDEEEIQQAIEEEYYHKQEWVHGW